MQWKAVPGILLFASVTAILIWQGNLDARADIKPEPGSGEMELYSPSWSSVRKLGSWPRLNISELRVNAGRFTMVNHDCPTLRWEVLPQASASTPKPRFYPAGSGVHVVDNSNRDYEYREIVFELCGASKPRMREEEIKRWMNNTIRSPLVGTELVLENDLLRAVDLHLPPGGGDACNDFHQHIMDYGFVFLGEGHEPSSYAGAMDFLRLPQPPPHKGCEGEILLNDNMSLYDGSATYHSITPGDTSGHALHNLVNADPNKWLRCYQVELK